MDISLSIFRKKETTVNATILGIANPLTPRAVNQFISN